MRELCALLLLVSALAAVNGHGYLKEPIARSSIQLRPEFNTEGPYYWDNEAVWCDNVPQNLQYSRCGRCGDKFGEGLFNQGGYYDKPIIVATYQAGAVVEMQAEFGATHYGHFELELCPQDTETDNCFQKLPIVSSSEGTEIRDGNRVCVPWDNSQRRVATVRVWLPAGVRCDRCTIRWTYRTSYPPHGWEGKDICDDPTEAQTFRNCANVRIV